MAERKSLNKKNVNEQSALYRMDDVVESIVASYEEIEGMNNLDGGDLPSKGVVRELADEYMSLVFPGLYLKEYEEHKNTVRYVHRKCDAIADMLESEIEKSLHFDCHRGGGPCDHDECYNVARYVTRSILEEVPSLRRLAYMDARAAFNNDPAAKSLFEVVLSYPGIEALTVYRFANRLHHRAVPVIPRMLTEHVHGKTGIDINPGAEIGESAFIDHGTGVVIGETAVVGKNVKIYQGVTLGALSVTKDMQEEKRHPTIGDNVTIYAGATILGGDTVVGENSIIGGNVWILESVAPGSKIYVKSPDQVCKMCMKDFGCESSGGDKVCPTRAEKMEKLQSKES